MRALLVVLLAAFSSAVMAEKTTNVIDIINNSNLAMTVTYNVCTFGADNTGNIIEKDCKENSVLLPGKESGSNKVSIDAKFAPLHPPKQDLTYDTTAVYIAKIHSNLGSQTFISSYNDLNLEDPVIWRGLHINLCSNLEMTYSPGPAAYLNVIVLDNYGTNKVYCHATSQAS